MTKDQDSSQPPDGAAPVQQQQQQPRPQVEPAGHAGQGADSALQEMRAWEQRRAEISGGKPRQG